MHDLQCCAVCCAARRWVLPSRRSAARPRRRQPNWPTRPVQIHPDARRREAARISARGCWPTGSASAGDSRWSSRTVPAATASSPSTRSSPRMTIMCCCLRRRRRSPRIRFCTTTCPTSRAISSRSRGCPTPSSPSRCPPSLNVDSLAQLVALARARARQAQLGRRHRRARFHVCRLAQAAKTWTSPRCRTTTRSMRPTISPRAACRSTRRRWRSCGRSSQSGKIKLLAVTNTARAPTEPNMPTVKEAGYPALTIDGLVGLFGPTGMPLELRQRITVRHPRRRRRDHQGPSDHHRPDS